MNQNEKFGRYLSFLLRHHPEAAGVQLDEKGWAAVPQLLEGMRKNGYKIDFNKLEEIVATNDKKRYNFNEDKTKIRANQGHSLEVDVELKQLVPPVYLYHGTAGHFLNSIKKKGLKKQGRNHIHLSLDRQTAESVGKRHGLPIVLKIHSGKMHQEGYIFYLSENGVWLTDYIPSDYIYIDEML